MYLICPENVRGKELLILKIWHRDRGLMGCLYFDICTSMRMEDAVEALGALAQESRLKVFWLLVQQGPEGMPAGTIAAQFGITPATMSHHLDQLSQAGLVTSRRDGRSIIYRANYEQMQRLMNYLMENCCQGKQECGNEEISRSSGG